MSNTNTLASTKFKNNIRTVSGTYIVMDSDVVLLCDTSSAPVTIELALIPADYFSTQYKLYIVDNNNNATTNNILINAPTGSTINGDPSYTIQESGQSIQIFISSNTNYGIANAVNSPVTNQISDEAFGSSWNGVTNMGASKNALYDEIISIGAGFGNTAFVRIGGNNDTAQIGNILRPFGDIGTAIYGSTVDGINQGNGLMGALTDPSLPFNQITNPYLGTGVGFSTGSSLRIEQGAWTGLIGVNDTNCPQGLKPNGSKFDVFCDVGCVITYTGSYGLWVNATTATTGNLYGFLEVDCAVSTFNGTSNGISGYLFNFGEINSRRIYQMQRVTVTNSGNAIRLGASNGAGSELTLQRLVTGTGTAIKCDPNCLFDVSFNILQTDGVAVSLDNTGSSFYSARFYFNIIQGVSVTATGVSLIRIEQPSSATINRIEFNNGNITSISTSILPIVQFVGTCTNTRFKNSMITGTSAPSSFGASTGSATPKLWSVISNKDLAVSVTNLLSTGFTYDTNL